MQKPKVLLINPRTYPGTGIDPLEDKHPPFGLASLAAYVRQYGYLVNILDMRVSNVADDDIGEHVRGNGYTVVGITSMTHQITNGYKLAKEIKKHSPEVKIVFGGVHVTFCYEEALRQDGGCIDFVVKGEGEFTFLELLRALDEGEAYFYKIKGLAFMDRVNNRLIVTAEREFIPNLDKLPFIARDLLPMQEYFKGETIFGNSMIEIMASRGCPYNCVFCSSPAQWKRKVRFRSIDNVIEEINLMVKTYDIRYFEFLDDGFTLDKKFTMNFCHRLLKEKVKIRWRCLARVDNVNNELLCLMKKAGCVKICYGIESGNQRILDFEDKKIKISQIKEVFFLTHRVGISTLALMILGHPLENHQTIAESINLIRQIQPFRYVFQCMTPYVGTKLYEKIAPNTGVILSKKWEDYRSTERPVFVPHGLTRDELIRYHDEFMDENYSFKHVIRRIFIAYTLVGKDIFNKKFFLKPLYYSLYNSSSRSFKKFLDLALMNVVIPFVRGSRKIKSIFLK